MRKTARGAWVVLTLTALVLSGCAGPGVAATPDESVQGIESGGVVKVFAFSEMKGFDPVNLTSLGSGVERALNVFDSLLFREDSTDAVYGKLAEGISTEDAITWVLELREGVEFTDGTPLNAEAVIFNLERHLAPDSTSTAKAQLSSVERMEATGEYQVTFTLKSASGSFPLSLTASSPASLIGSPAALADPETFNTAPVGAGPFVVKEWVRDDSLTFERNENYWDSGRPYLEGLEYGIITNSQTAADALLTGSVDIGLSDSPTWAQLVDSPNLNLVPVTTGGTALVPNGSRAPGDDERVRQAIAMAFDTTTTANVLLGGTQVTGNDFTCVPFPVDSPACAPDATYAQDLEQAKALIDDFVADGGDPSSDLVYFNSLIDQATYVQSQLAEIGLDVTLRAVDVAGLLEAQSSGEYGLLWGSTASAGFPTVWTRYSSEGTNWGKVAYPELDEALLRARDEIELADRNAAWRDATTFIHDNSLWSWLLPYSSAMTYSTKLHLGSPEHPYAGSTAVYFDHAWLEQP